MARDVFSGMDRRSIIKSLGVAGGASLAGYTTCEFIGERGTILGVIEIINFSQVRNRIRILVDRNGETLLDEKFTLEPLDTGKEGFTEIIQPQWRMTNGRYTLRAVHYGADGDRETGDWTYTFTGDDYSSYYGDEAADPGCIGAIVKIGSDSADRNAPIGISPTRVESPCGSE